ncbi:MAG: thioesterase family protein, partial [Pseudomonadota bacterium]
MNNPDRSIAGFASQTRGLDPTWIDYNGHLNMAYYLVLFEEGAEDFWKPIGLGDRYRDRTGHTTYTASTKIDYIAEVAADAQVFVQTVLREAGPKKFLIWQGLYTSDGTLRATCETLTLHVDQTGETPKVAPFDATMLEKLHELVDEHAEFEPPHPTGLPVQ